MIHHNVNLIAAIGNNGQIGLDGKLPWQDSDDLKRFKELTMGGVLIVGSTTAEQLPPLHGRIVHVFNRTQNPLTVVNSYPAHTIWIAGGAKVYEIFGPYVRNHYITKIDYDGPADTFFPINALTITNQ